MKVKKDKFFRIIFFILPILVFSFFTFYAQAGTGTIDGTYDTAEFVMSDGLGGTVFNPDGGTIKFQCDTNCTGNNWGITITDTSISGYAWGDEVGWIKFKCTENCTGNDWGVDVEVATVTTGILSGYAWGQNTGWINFDPSKGGVTITTTIDESEFSGYAWAQNYGWIKFDCSAAGILAGQCVKTNWQPTLGGGGGDGGSTTCSLPNTLVNGICTPPSTTCSLPNTLVNGVCTPPTTPTFCQLNPTDPSCVTPPFCQTHPTDPSCVTPPLPCEQTGTCPPPPPPPSQPDILQEITNTIDDIISAIKKINAPIRNFIEKIFYPVTVEKIDKGLKVAAIASVLFGGVLSIATALFLNPLAMPELILIPFRLWALLLSALGLSKKIKPWGTVYDAVTKQPLDPVYVSLFNLEGAEIASSITDIDGRYGFFVEPGVYKVVPKKTNYIFPSHALADNFKDELYQDLYFGDYLNISAGEMIVKNIPMDPINFDWNEFAKNKKQLLKYYSKKELMLSRISNWLFGFGFTVATVALVISPEKYNIVIFGLYVLMFILRRTSFKLRAKGRVVGSDGLPLSFAFIRIFSIRTNVEISHKVTDKMGRYHMLVPNGAYYVKIEKKNNDGSYSLVHTSNHIKIAHGTLNKVFNI